MIHMLRTAPTLAVGGLLLAAASGTLCAQQLDERPLHPGTWEVRFVFNDTL